MAALAAKEVQWPYDVFVSHQGSDKESIAVPLFGEMKKRRINPFLDRKCLWCGHYGPAIMNHVMETAPIIGVFVLSPEFFAKKWPFQELQCFLSRYEQALLRENRQHGPPPLLIPVFHRLSWEECGLDTDEFFSKFGHVFDNPEFGFRDREQAGQVSKTQVISALSKLRGFSGIERKIGGDYALIMETAKKVQRELKHYVERLEGWEYFDIESSSSSSNALPRPLIPLISSIQKQSKDSGNEETEHAGQSSYSPGVYLAPSSPNSNDRSCFSSYVVDSGVLSLGSSQQSFGYQSSKCGVNAGGKRFVTKARTIPQRRSRLLASNKSKRGDSFCLSSGTRSGNARHSSSLLRSDEQILSVGVTHPLSRRPVLSFQRTTQVKSFKPRQPRLKRSDDKTKTLFPGIRSVEMARMAKAFQTRNEMSELPALSPYKSDTSGISSLSAKTNYLVHRSLSTASAISALTNPMSVSDRMGSYIPVSTKSLAINPQQVHSRLKELHTSAHKVQTMPLLYGMALLANHSCNSI